MECQQSVGWLSVECWWSVNAGGGGGCHWVHKSPTLYYCRLNFVVVWVIVWVCSVVLRRTVVGVDWCFNNLSGSHHQSLMMASAQVVETSVNTNNSPSQNYTTNPDDHSNHNIASPGFKPFTVRLNFANFVTLCTRVKMLTWQFFLISIFCSWVIPLIETLF